MSAIDDRPQLPQPEPRKPDQLTPSIKQQPEATPNPSPPVRLAPQKTILTPKDNPPRSEPPSMPTPRSSVPLRATTITIDPFLSTSLNAFVQADLEQNLKQHNYPEGQIVTVEPKIDHSFYSTDGSECPACIRRISTAGVIIKIVDEKGTTLLRGEGRELSLPGERIPDETLDRKALSQAISNAFSGGK